MKKKKEKNLNCLARGEFPKNFWDYNIHPITGEQYSKKTKTNKNNPEKLKKWS